MNIVPLRPIARRRLFLVAVVMISTTVHAAEIRRAQPILGTSVRPGQWIPIEVSLENRDRPTDLDVGLEFSSTDRTARYYTRVNLPSPSRKRVFVYGIAEDVLTGTRARIPGIRQPDLNLQSLNANDSLIGVVSREEGGLSFLSSLREVGPAPMDRGATFGSRALISGQAQVHVRYLQPSSVPDHWVGLESLRLLVLLGISSRDIDSAQAGAIAKYVAAGGTVVVCGGGDWQRLTGELYKDLLPLEISGSTVLNGSRNLEQRYGAKFNQQDPLVVAVGRVRGGTRNGLTIASENGVPLIMKGNYGAGNVIFLAFDPSRPPIAGWDGSETLWTDILTWSDRRPRSIEAAGEAGMQGFGGGRVYYSGQFDSSPSIAAAFAQDRKEMQAPPFELIGFFLIAYIVCLVPVNYLILKKLDRLEWAWVTTPAIVAVFTVSSYAVGYYLKGGVLLASKLTIVQGRAGERWGRADTYLGIFSPGKRSYDILSGDPNAACADLPTENMGTQRSYLRVNEDRGFRIEEAAINMWTMRMFQSRSVVDLNQGMRAQFRMSQNAPSIILENRTGHSFGESWILTSRSRTQVPSLANGAKTEAKLGNGREIRTQSPVEEAALSELELGRHPGREAVIGADEAVFLGWTTESLDAIKIADSNPEYNSRCLILVRIPIDYAIGTVISEPTLRSRVVASKTSQAVSLGSQGEWILQDGWLTFEINLPVMTGRRLSPETLSLVANYMGGRGTRVSVYNFDAGRWVQMIEIAQGDKKPHSIDPPASYIRFPDGIIRIRIDAGNSGRVQIHQLSAQFRGRVVAARSGS